MRGILQFLALLPCLLAVTAHAVTVEPDVSSQGIEVFPLQNASAAARPSAMGSAFVAVADGAEGFGFNPAGLGMSQGFSAAFGHNTLMQEAFQDALQISMPLGGRWGNAGIRGDYVNYGSMAIYDARGVNLGNRSLNEYRGGLSWGLPLIGGTALGLGAKYSQQVFGDLAKESLGIDAGVLWKVMKGIQLGVASHGAGGPASDARRYWSTGIGSMASARFGVLKLLGSGEVILGQGEKRDIQAGLESWFFDSLALRGGIKSSLNTSSVRYTMGLGFAINAWNLDYAWLPLPYGEGFHQLGLRYALGQPETAAQTLNQSNASKTLGAPPLAVPSLTPQRTPALLPDLPAFSSDASPSSTALPLGTQAHVLSPAASQALDLEQAGKHPEAFKAYYTAVSQDSADIHAWRGLARSYERGADLAHARQCWQRVQALDPEASDAKAWLAK
jgi:hypothetical protein